MSKRDPRSIIYGLADPRTNEIRYIGQSSRGRARIGEHMMPSIMARDASFYSTRWLAELQREHLRPHITELEEVSDEKDLDAVECFWIAQGRGLQWPLTNIMLGGGAKRAYVVSQETREKLRIASMGRTHTTETRAKLSRVLRGRIIPPDVRVKMSATRTGVKLKPHTEEAKEKMRLAHLGKTHTPEARANMGNSRRGKPRSAETKAKISAAHTGKIVSSETCEKIRLSRLGTRASEETRAKMSATHRERAQAKRDGLPPEGVV